MHPNKNQPLPPLNTLATARPGHLPRTLARSAAAASTCIIIRGRDSAPVWGPRGLARAQPPRRAASKARVMRNNTLVSHRKNALVFWCIFVLLLLFLFLLLIFPLLVCLLFFFDFYIGLSQPVHMFSGHSSLACHREDCPSNRRPQSMATCTRALTRQLR